MATIYDKALQRKTWLPSLTTKNSGEGAGGDTKKGANTGRAANQMSGDVDRAAMNGTTLAMITVSAPLELSVHAKVMLRRHLLRSVSL